MKKDSVSGAALILGAAAGVVTMAFHPSATDLLSPGADVAAINLRNIAVHSLGIAASWVMLFGAVGLSRRLDDDTGLATAGLVAFALAAVAILGAATASGFVATDVVRHIVPTNEGGKQVVAALFAYTGIVNQAFARVDVAASSVAIALWSSVIVLRRSLPRPIGVAGLAVAAGCLAALVAGLPLNVHVFGAIVLGQTVWFVAVGLWLRRPAQA